MILKQKTFTGIKALRIAYTYSSSNNPYISNIIVDDVNITGSSITEIPSVFLHAGSYRNNSGNFSSYYMFEIPCNSSVAFTIKASSSRTSATCQYLALK